MIKSGVVKRNISGMIKEIIKEFSDKRSGKEYKYKTLE